MFSICITILYNSLLIQRLPQVHQVIQLSEPIVLVSLDDLVDVLHELQDVELVGVHGGFLTALIPHEREQHASLYRLLHVVNDVFGAPV